MIPSRLIRFGTGDTKYRNCPTVTPDGIKHPSIKEADRWNALNLLKRAGRIRELRRQVTYQIKTHDGLPICRYIADFVYEEYEHGEWVSITEDAKGFPTPVYRLKKKLMRLLMGVSIRET